MPLAFLAPLALSALALAALPVAIHMLRRARARRLEFPSLRFLRETPTLARTFASPQQKALLALRVAAVLAIAFALSRPVWVGGPGTGELAQERAVVVLLDASASMTRESARAGAIGEARRRLEALALSDRVSVGAFAESVSWLADAVSPAEAAAAGERYTPGRGAADPLAAFAEAARVLTAAPQAKRTLVIVSDFQRANGSWRTALLDGSIAVEAARVGDDYANAFLASIAVERAPEGDRVAVGTVLARGDERVASVVTLPLEDGAAGRGVRLERAGDGWRAVATDADDLDADDALRFGVAGPPSLVVVERGEAAPFLRAAAGTIASDAEGAEAAAEGTLAGHTHALVTQRALGAAGGVDTLEAWVRAGGHAVVFAPEPRSWPFPEPGETVATRGLVREGAVAGPPDAVDRALAEGGVSAARRVSAEPSDDVLLRSVDGASVAVRRRMGAGTVTVVGFDPRPDTARVVLDGAFPSLVEWLAGIATPHVERIPEEESEPAALAAGEVDAEVARPATSDGAAPEAVLVETEKRQQGWRFALAAALGLALVELVAASRRRREAQ